MISNFNEYTLLTESLSMNDISIKKIKQLLTKFNDKYKVLDYLINAFNTAKNKGIRKNIARLLIVMYIISFATKNNKWVNNISANDLSEVSTSMTDIENMTERELQDFMGDKTYLYDNDDTKINKDTDIDSLLPTQLINTKVEDKKLDYTKIKPTRKYVEVAAKYVEAKKLHTTQGTIDFIKNHEKLRLTAYVLRYTKKDKNGKPILDKNGKKILLTDGKITIGYGHAERKAISKYKEGDEISKNKAERLFKKDLKKAEDGIKRIFRDWKKQKINIEITQSMFDAMVSMTFNMGVNGMRKTKFIQEIKKGDFISASNLIKTSRVGNISGLRTRRLTEYKLFMKDIS